MGQFIATSASIHGNADRGGYARYVGRVGALAVALGVGMAVATGYGTGTPLARADDEPGTTENVGSSDGSDGVAGTAGADGSDGADGAEGDTGDDADVDDDAAEEGGGQSLDPDDDPAAGLGEDTPEAATTPDPADEPPTASTSNRPTRKNNSAPSPDRVSIPRDTGDDVDSSATALNVFVPKSSRVSGAFAGGTADLQLRTTNANQSVAAALADTSVAETQEASTGVSGAFVSIASTFVAAVLSPFVAPGPGSPAEPPLAWALLAWARRESEPMLNGIAGVKQQETAESSAPQALSEVTIAAVTANDDEYSVNEDTGLNVGAANGVLANDDSGDPEIFLSAHKLTDPSHGEITEFNSDGSFAYVPHADFHGTDSFTYTPDFDGSQQVATVTITVNSVNDAPTAVADGPFSLTEDTIPTFSAGQLVANDHDPDVDPDDPDGDTLSVNSVGGAIGGTVKLNANGTVTFTPTANYNGPASFIYRVKDSTGTTSANTAKVTLNVTPANDAPTAVADGPFDVTEDGSRTFSHLVDNDTDPDAGDTLKVNSVGGAINGAVKLNADGTVTFTPIPNYSGPASFIYRVKDSTGATSANTAKVTLNVTPVNDAPTAVADSKTMTEDVARTFTANDLVGNDTDPDLPGDTLSVNSVGVATHGTVKLNANGTVTFTPDANYNGPASFIYRVKDSTGTTSANTATVSLKINPANDAPIAVADSAAAIRNTARTFTANDLVGNDIDIDKVEGDTLSVNSVGGATNGTVKLNADGTVTFTPATNYTGPASFIYRVKDSTGTTSANTAKVSLTVKATNAAPTAVGESRTMSEDVPRTFTASNLVGNDTDPDGDTLSINSVGGAINGTVKLNADGTVTFTPTANYNGPASFIYRVKDSTGTTSANTAKVSLTINPVNDAPVGGEDFYVVEQGAVLNVPDPGVVANDFDVDGDEVRADIESEGAVGPSHGGVMMSGFGGFTYTPDPGYSGPDSFTYLATDLHGGNTPTTVHITVNPAV